ncbi:MAG: CocE/NonD family hydrolase [Planctomycetota bacterium]|nr:CocE/NonD family hydrolase [Planctomycetota bacterium]
MRASRLLPLLLVLCGVGFIAPSAAQSQGVESIKAHYTKYEYRIPMRDGKRLFTSVYAPKDQSTTYPIMLSRTPYSCQPYGVDQFKADLGPSPLFANDGYIFVYQDVRGRWMSEGDYVNMRPQIPNKQGADQIDESSDSYDTIDWLVKHVKGNNGKVGIWGVSYPGFYTSAAIIDAHPAVACASPQAPIADWFVGDDWHHNGALILPHCFNFMSKFGHARPEPTKKFDHPFDHGTPDGYEFFLRMGPLSNADGVHFQGKIGFWNEIMRHGTYDEFWKSRNLRPHLKDIRPAVLTVGGWFDAENLFGALETYRSIEKSSPNATNLLVMGPWRHGQWTREPCNSLGHVDFHSKTGEFYREQIEFPFFQQHLKGKTEAKHPEAWVFETGTNRWRQEAAWPPAASQPREFYLQAGGGLNGDVPVTTDGNDDYPSDPAKPVPFIDWTDNKLSTEYMVADQRYAGRRPDVLVYQTKVLESDLTVSGPIEVDLYVSTTGTDSDWIVKVIDVYPDDFPDPKENPQKVRLGGFQQLVRGDVMRGKFRNGLDRPEAFEPGKPTRVKFTLPDICHAFRPGHRLMVQIHSTWFPLVDRNPQKFVDIYAAKPADFQKATQRVYRTREFPSKLVLRVEE